MVQSFACPACAEPLPAGRLSCPQCGTVLAAVARTYRAGGDPPVSATAATPSSLERSWLDEPVRDTRPDETVAAPVALAAEPAATHVPLTSAAEPASAPEREQVEVAGPIPTPVAALLDAPPGSRDDERSQPLGDDEEVEAAAASPVPVESRRYGLTPSYMPVRPRTILDVLKPADAGLDQDPMATTPTDAETPASPSSPSSQTFTDDTEPATDAVAAAWIPPAVMTETADEPPARILPRAWDPVGAAAAAAGTSMTTHRRLPFSRPALPAIDRARIDDAAGVAVMAGAMGAAIGFVLPWSRVVIGARSAGGYFDSWGLAGPAHLVVFLLALGALMLASVPNGISTWLRTGVVGIGLGSLLLGLAWPYAFGPLGAGVGTVLAVVSASILIVAGLVSTAVQRHAEPPPGV